MIFDLHCHVGFSARRVAAEVPRFSFEPHGAAGSPGFDSYLSPRLFGRPAWFFVRRWLGLDRRLGRGEALDAQIEAVNERQWTATRGVDRLVLLAFDEYHDDAGRPVGMARRGQRLGSDLYVSNSLVRALCAARPNRFLFGGSVHPYRVHEGPTGRGNACDLLSELAAGGAVLIKWLPIHQNIRADDPRTIAFLRRAAELRVPMLIHYGGEMSLSHQHREFESPVPLLRVLHGLRREGKMPTVMVSHAATPSFIWQSAAGHRALVDALLGQFADAPLYAEIAALGAFGRTRWLRRLARRKELQRKLVWGSDYPVPVMVRAFWRVLDRRTRLEIAALPSWIDQSLRLAQAMGYDQGVFTRAAEILRLSPDRRR